MAPKEQALGCNDCHNSGVRINFQQLGYAPKTERHGVPLCSSCHSPERASFYKIHQEHVQEEHLNCRVCHNF